MAVSACCTMESNVTNFVVVPHQHPKRVQGSWFHTDTSVQADIGSPEGAAPPFLYLAQEHVRRGNLRVIVLARPVREVGALNIGTAHMFRAVCDNIDCRAALFTRLGIRGHTLDSSCGSCRENPELLAIHD